MMKITLPMACLIGAASLATAQNVESPAMTRWSQLRFLLGEWRGSIQGDQGTGSITRSFRLILSGEFMQERSTYNFPPQPLHPNGSVTTVASFLALDQAHALRLYRQDEQEQRNGVFLFSKALSQPAKLVFEMEHPSGPPVSWKARETWEVISPNAFVEIVEVAQDGKIFTVQSRIQFNRRQP